MKWSIVDSNGNDYFDFWDDGSIFNGYKSKQDVIYQYHEMLLKGLDAKEWHIEKFRKR